MNNLFKVAVFAIPMCFCIGSEAMNNGRPPIDPNKIQHGDTHIKIDPTKIQSRDAGKSRPKIDPKKIQTRDINEMS